MGLPDKENIMSLLGFWATFQKGTTVELMNQYKKNVFAYYSRKPKILLETIEYLELPYIFVRSNEEGYARISHLLWKHRGLIQTLFLEWVVC